MTSSEAARRLPCSVQLRSSHRLSCLCDSTVAPGVLSDSVPARPSELILYHGESWELMLRRWVKLEKDFKTANGKFDISKIPDIYDNIKYDLQHNQKVLQFDDAEEMYRVAKTVADVIVPQVSLPPPPHHLPLPYVCGKAFNRLDALTSHHGVHTALREVGCDICGECSWSVYLASSDAN